MSLSPLSSALSPPLSPAAPRQTSHLRQVTCTSFRRADGFLDIEGALIDTKSYDIPSAYRGVIKAGEPIHLMHVRITIDFDLVIKAAEAVTSKGPYQICPKGAENIKGLIGLTIGPGWRRRVQKAIGGKKGCTHITELMGPIATTAMQTIYSEKARQARLSETEDAPAPTPAETFGASLANSCIGYAIDQ